MKRRRFNLCLGVAVAVPTILGTEVMADAGSQWSIIADVAESCSCEIPCPCNFGRPTTDRCDGSRLIQITEGNIDGADLAGISFVATFEMREWVKLYVDETLSNVQMRAFANILPAAFSGFHKLTHLMELVPLTVARADDTVRFSVPASTVEIKLLRGKDGKPITIDGLPSPAFYNYTQYESVIHTHTSSSAKYSYSGTNGFTSKMIVSSSR
jgi:hypothetical protein